MTTLLNISVIFFVHTYFCLSFIFFGVREHQFAGQHLEFLFGREGIDFILYISLISIFMIILARYTPINLRFSNISTLGKGKVFGIYITVITYISFISYLVYSASAHYGILATQRHEYSFLIELRYIPYLLIIQYFSSQNQHNKRFIFFLVLVSCVSLMLYQSRSIMFEILIITICLILRKNMDRIKLYFFPLLILLLPISNFAIAIRRKLSMEEYIQTMWEFEYLILINNKLAATLNYDYEYKAMWIIERMNLLIPSFIRHWLEIENPSNELFLEISAIAQNFSGGFSYLGNLYILFGNFFFIILYVIYLILEVTRRNFMLYKTNNYLAYIYPLLLSCTILAVRNDVGVLFKQIFQIIVIAIVLNIISRIRWKN